jgi:hypothetical protein
MVLFGFFEDRSHPTIQLFMSNNMKLKRIIKNKEDGHGFFLLLIFYGEICFSLQYR